MGKHSHSHGKNWRETIADWAAGRVDSTERPGFAAAAQAALDASSTDGAADAPDDGRYRSGCTLADLVPGECGTVRKLLGSSHARLRLMEMGLTPGAHIKVIRIAAFGGPLDILIRGYQLSLRRDEAAGVWLDDEIEV